MALNAPVVTGKTFNTVVTAGRLAAAAVLWTFIVIAGSLAASERGQTLTFDERTGLFAIRHETAPIISAQFVFWRDEWRWAGLNISARAQGDGRYSVTGTNKDTGLTLRGGAQRTDERSIEWRLDLAETNPLPGRHWGGIAFKLDASPLADGGNVPRPVIDSDQGGFRIDTGAGALAVRFEPSPAMLFFERKSESEIRAYFNDTATPIGRRHFKMTVSLPPTGKVTPTMSERVAAVDPVSWRANATGVHHAPIDLSFLNAAERPAGRRGWLKAEGGQLRFADGTLARFWGTNLTAHALFGTALGDTRRQAQRLSRLGFNLVRIHHHDSEWVSPNIFGAKGGGTRSLDPQALKKLDWWIKCLKDEGIHVWLDLDAGRTFTAADGISDFSEMAKGRERARPSGFAYVNRSIRERMKEFAAQYLSHVNEFTGLAYKDDPAIAFILITNEHDLTYHFGNALLPDKKVPNHNALYMEEARKFALANGLNGEKTWRSWEHGPSKLFLNDLEHRFNGELINYLRDMGVKALIATTNYWGDMPMAGLPALAAGDIVDAHAYATPDFLKTNPWFQPNLIHWMAAAGVEGKPLTVTEWNVSPFPAIDRSSLPAYVAATASFQGWSGLMEYAYSQSPPNDAKPPNNWEFANDPALLVMMPAAALIYRQGHVKEGKTPVTLAPTASDLIDRPLSPNTSRAIRTLTERHKFRVALPVLPSLPWLQVPAGQPELAVTDMNTDFSNDTGQLCSDTEEVCRDWRNGVLRIDTERTQLVSGWIGGRALELKDTSFAIDTANASIAVQSLDGAAIVGGKTNPDFHGGAVGPCQGARRFTD